MLDEKDWLILDVLKENANLTTRSIARKTMLPVTTVHNRILKLRQAGIIKRYTIELDYSKVGKAFSAYIMITADLKELKRMHRTQYDLAEDLRRLPQIENVDIVSGGTDIIAYVRVKDIDEFDTLLLGIVQPMDGIEKTRSMIVIHRH